MKYKDLSGDEISKIVTDLLELNDEYQNSCKDASFSAGISFAIGYAIGSIVKRDFESE